MVVVDICDQEIECYKTWFKFQKWTREVVLYFEFVNSLFQYNKIAALSGSRENLKNNQTSLLRFKLQVADALIASPFSKTKK